MKLSELQEIALKLDIPIKKEGTSNKLKNKTKAELCDDLEEFNNRV